MTNKHHKWLVTLEQLKRHFGDDLRLIIASYVYDHDCNEEEVMAFLGDLRDQPMTDGTYASAVSNQKILQRMIKIDADFAMILKAQPVKKTEYPEGSRAHVHRKLQAVWNPFALEHGFRVIRDRFDDTIREAGRTTFDVDEESRFMIVNAHNNGLIRWCKNGRLIFYKKRKAFGRIVIPEGTPVGFTPVAGVTNYAQEPNSCEKE